MIPSFIFLFDKSELEPIVLSITYIHRADA